MPTLTIIYGEETHTIEAPESALLGDIIAQTELPLEQPCAGRGTCGKCKVLNEGGLAPPDEIEHQHLTAGEIAVGNRLACRARIESDTRVALAPIMVYSNKIFKASSRYRKERDVPLGLAIDLGSTTVAAFLTMLDNGEVCAGAASLNQQTVYGSDVISRLNAAHKNPVDAERLHRLALASINQAIDALKLSKRIQDRVVRATIVCNPAMHHLLAQLPVDSLSVMPFQPHNKAPIRDAADQLGGIFPSNAQVDLPPLIGGFVGADALACLSYFDFDRTSAPMAAIDLGTNGEVMVTDGDRILTASTAAGPAFEGVNISCGTRAIDGAITHLEFQNGQLSLTTISDEAPIGLTGSGLLSAVHAFLQADLIKESGRINAASELQHQKFNPDKFITEERFDDKFVGREIMLTRDGNLRLNQWDIRELQKAKGAIRAALDVLMARLKLEPNDLQRVILTGSFGGAVNLEAVLALGMIPPVAPEKVETIANGAGFGAAQFLTDEGFARGVAIAEKAEQIDLDADPDFIEAYVNAMALKANT
jgi:uncharacterized 2Fe-2S/4Fe-4S cluster protein (DUF4445 family)